MKDVKISLLESDAVSIYLDQSKAGRPEAATGAKSVAILQMVKQLFHHRKTSPMKKEKKLTTK
jgi:hypothetical protein